MNKVFNKVNQASFKKGLRFRSIALLTLVVASPLTAVQAKVGSILVDNSPIKPENVNTVHLDVIDKLKKSVIQRLKALDAFNKVTKNEKEVLLKCVDAFCQMDSLNSSASARDAYAKVLEQQYQDLISFEKSDFKVLYDAAKKEEDAAYKRFDDKRSHVRAEYERVKPLLASVVDKNASTEALKKSFNSDQWTQLRIFSDEVRKNKILLSQLKSHTQSLQQVKLMFQSRADWIHNYSNQVNVLSKKLKGHAEIQRGESETIRISARAKQFEDGLGQVFSSFNSQSNSAAMPFMPEIKRYMFNAKKFDAPVDNSVLAFLKNGSLDSFTSLLNWER